MIKLKDTDENLQKQEKTVKGLTVSLCNMPAPLRCKSNNYNWDRFREKGPSAYYKICYKNALRLNRYNFRTVHDIDFLFSTLHGTPFLYVDLYFHVLHKIRADVMRPDYPWGSKLPHLQVGASNSFQIQCVCRGVLSLLIFSVR